MAGAKCTNVDIIDANSKLIANCFRDQEYNHEQRKESDIIRQLHLDNTHPMAV